MGGFVAGGCTDVAVSGKYYYSISEWSRSRLTGDCDGYFLGSETWSAGSLMGLLSKVARNDLAKVTSDIMVREKEA